nr:DUF5655 domain-containing protein [uncultured Schaedlerella sp.]
MTQDTLLFFNSRPQALPLYELFEQKLLSELGSVNIKVQKTQIAFSNKHNFAFVSFLPVRKAKERPETYIVITFGLGRRVESPRIDAAVEPYPNRWTHHVLISDPDEIDEELMGWVKEAAAFSDAKRR